MMRAKFICTKITETVTGKEVEFTPVTATSEENKIFFQYTPYGSIKLGTINPDIQLLIGKEYFVDFTVAE